MKFRIKHFKSFPLCVDVGMKMNGGVWMICFLIWKGKKKHLRLTCSLIVKKELKNEGLRSAVMFKKNKEEEGKKAKSSGKHLSLL